MQRTIVNKHASDGTIALSIRNEADSTRPVVYSEVWPWWVKGWVSEMELRIDDDSRNRSRFRMFLVELALIVGTEDLLSSFEYHPSHPPKPSTTSLHLHLNLPPHSTLHISLPFTKLTLKYTEHRPDAERGVDIPSGILTLLDVEGEDTQDDSLHFGQTNHRKTGRRRIYTSRLLLDVPTPDFSMPYNVIIMSSTVMAVFFGLMHGALTRRWGWVELPDDSLRPSPGRGETADVLRVEAEVDGEKKDS